MSKKILNEGYKPSMKKGYQPTPNQGGDKKTGYQPPTQEKKPVSPPKKD